MGRTEKILLLALLVLAAGLRFGGLAHGLARGSPEFDERQNFVDPILKMWRKGSPDPTVYNGYPGFFNYIAFLPVGIGHRLGGEPGAYAAARGVVAAFGVLGVALAFAAARRLAGAAAGLFAAAAVALAYIDVRSAHYVTADVLVGTAVLALLWIQARDPGAARSDWLAGAVTAAAIAVKYTGLLLVPAVLAGLWAARRPRASYLRAAAAGALCFAATAPYAAFGLSEQGLGLVTGIEQYYTGAGGNRFARGEGSASGTVPAMLWVSLGPVGTALALLGLARGPRRALMPAAAVVVAAVAVTLPANLVYPRHAVPAVDAAAVLAGVGYAVLAGFLNRLRLGRALAAAAAVSALAVPARSSFSMVARYLRRPAVDRAAEWVETQARAPALVLTSLRRFQVAPDRFEVRSVESLPEIAPSLPAAYDLVVATRAEAESLLGLDTAAQFVAEDDRPELDLLVLRPRSPTSLGPCLPSRVGGTAGASSGAAWDGNPATRLPLPEGPVELEAEFADPVDALRVEVTVAGPGDWPQPLQLLGTADGVRWEPLASEALRPNRPPRQRPPHGQVYLLTPPRPLRGLRLERRAGAAWTVADVRVLARVRP